MTFVPYPNKVVIKPIKRETPFPTPDEKFEEMGEVVAVGSDVTFVEVGDLVFFRQFAYMKTPEVNGERFYIIQVGDDTILGKISHVPAE